MAVIENRATEQGDVLVIKPEVPVIGLISLLQFVDTTSGETADDYFVKEFRYSLDGGLTFSSWAALNLENIQAVAISRFDAFVIEYRYTRQGSNPAVDLSFDEILLSGTYGEVTYPVYDKMAFKRFFEPMSIKVYAWALNVLEKLYRKGMILPDYIARADNNSALEDEDFIVYWNSITHYFAILVNYARQFESFSTNEILLKEFLKSKDLAFSDTNDLDDLVYIYNHYVDEYKKRGTMDIVSKKATSGIDGELLRLISYSEADDFMFALLQNFESGWCIGKSSPMWNNTENVLNLIKGYEFGDVESSSAYPWINDTYIAIDKTSDPHYITIENVPADTASGIDDSGDESFRILIDPSQDYEISFRVKKSALDSILSFGVRCFDVNGNEVSPVNFNTGADANYFFESKALSVVDKEYWIRGVLWNKDKDRDFTSRPNIGFGDSLQSVASIKAIVPIIYVKSAAPVVSKTYIRDVRVKPLKMNFSRGQLGIHNILYLMCKVNNKELTLDQIKQHISDKLISYNSFLKIKSL
jgi:hypothetical protein